MTSPSSLGDCLERTRSAVLNVLIVAGMGIAISGWLLRWRDREALFRGVSDPVRRGLLGALIALAVSSYAVRRGAFGRSVSGGPVSLETRFYRTHVLAAAIAAMAVPLGLVYGWLDRPTLSAVAPFWVVSLALGLLALPRHYELERLHDEHATGVSEPHP